MKASIIYQGKYGSTAQYAQWLAGSTGLPLANASSVRTGFVARYDCLLLGSAVYAGKLALHDWLKHNLTWLAGKKIFLFIVCGTTADRKEQQQTLIDAHVDPLIKSNCEIFFLPGRLIVSKFSWKDRMMIEMAALLESDPEKKAAMIQGYDRMKRRELDQLLLRVNDYREAAPGEAVPAEKTLT